MNIDEILINIIDQCKDHSGSRNIQSQFDLASNDEKE